MSQTGHNLEVNFQVETTFNTAPGSPAGEQLRINPGPGLTMTRALIRSQELRRDMVEAAARLGSRSVQGSYPVELSVGSFDTVLEALMRSTWVADVPITQAEMTSITTTASTIVAAGGSWITEGVRVGDIVRLTGHATAANNDRNLLVTGVTASVITVAETLTLDASPDTAFTLTIKRKLATATTPTRRSFYVEEYFRDLDLSVVLGGCRFSGFNLTGAPDGMANLDLQLVGASQTPLASGASPFYASPTQYTSKALTFADAVIRYDGADIAIATSFQLQGTNGASTLPVIGSDVTPDVYDNRLSLSASIAVQRADLAALTAFNAETELELAIRLTEPESEPKDFVNLFLPVVKIAGVSAPKGGDGALIETRQLIVNPKESGVSGYDAGPLTISTSAA